MKFFTLLIAAASATTLSPLQCMVARGKVGLSGASQARGACLGVRVGCPSVSLGSSASVSCTPRPHPKVYRRKSQKRRSADPWGSFATVRVAPWCNQLSGVVDCSRQLVRGSSKHWVTSVRAQMTRSLPAVQNTPPSP